jgi:hypothetical protein
MDWLECSVDRFGTSGLYSVIIYELLVIRSLVLLSHWI